MYAVGIGGVFLLLVSLFLLKYAEKNGNWAILIAALLCLAVGGVLARWSRVNRRK